LEQVLTRARRFANADAGSIYIRSGNQLHFSYTQNNTLCQRLGKGEKLIYSTFKIPIDKYSIAGYVALTGRSLNIADVYQIDPASPYQFNRQFDITSEYKTRSVLTIPLKTSNNNILGILQVINAQDEHKNIVSFSKNDEQVMHHFAGVASVALERAQMTRSTFLRMVKIAELRDPKETGPHVNRVAGYSVEIYEQWARNRGIDEKTIHKNKDILRMAAMLHDVGKVAISDLILKKPGPLDSNEFEVMKQHTILGAGLFADAESDFDKAARLVALNHHERWDGLGYPGHINVITGKPLPGYEVKNGIARGKKKEEIPIYGRIVAIADVYDALSTERVYKKAWDEPKILSTMENKSGKHFDPELMEIFFSKIDILKAIQKRYTENNEDIPLIKAITF
jgi:response regulator RpfG family c-di-GMP phosphodiesterase